MSSNTDFASLVSLLEPTPINEGLVSQMSSVGGCNDSNNASTAALLSFMIARGVPSHVLQGLAAGRGLPAQEAAVNDFCAEDYLHDFVEAASFAAITRNNGEYRPPHTNAFLSAPWFQGLNNTSVLQAGMNDPFERLMSPQPIHNSILWTASYTGSAPAVSASFSSEAATANDGYLPLNASSVMKTLPQHPLTSFSFSSSDISNDKKRSPKISDTQGLRWSERYTELVEFRTKYGHCCIPSYWPENTPLAQWVKRQRYQYKLRKEEREVRPSTLTEERIKALEDLGFVWDSHAAFWEERWNELRVFKERKGHTNIPTKFKENPQLGIWCKCRKYLLLFFVRLCPLQVLCLTCSMSFSIYLFRTSPIQDFPNGWSGEIVFDYGPNRETNGDWICL
jgi:hypothetical protein